MNQVKTNTQNLLQINGSKFIAYGYSIDNEIEIKNILKTLREENKKAVHVCYGYLLNQKTYVEKFDDDGEPKNSAGKKILQSLKDNDCVNSLIVVVRYKTKSMLGLGLLTRSYYNVCDELLKNKNNITIYEKTENITIDFADSKSLNKIIELLKYKNYKNYEINNDESNVKLRVKSDDLEYFQSIFSIKVQ